MDTTIHFVLCDYILLVHALYSILLEKCSPQWLYIMAFTSSAAAANAIDTAGHNVSIKQKTGELRSSVLPNLPGADYQFHKGDLWKLNLRTHFLFRDDCVQLSEIESIAMVKSQSDNVGWNIASIATFYRDDHYAGSAFQLATIDMDVNRWIDGDRARPRPVLASLFALLQAASTNVTSQKIHHSTVAFVIGTNEPKVDYNSKEAESKWDGEAAMIWINTQLLVHSKLSARLPKKGMKSSRGFDFATRLH